MSDVRLISSTACTCIKGITVTITVYDHHSIIKFQFTMGRGYAILKQQLIILSVDQMDHPIVISDLPVIKCCTGN